MSISKLRLSRNVATFLLIWTASFFSAEVVFRLLGDTPSLDLNGLYMQFGNGGYKPRPSVDTGAAWSTGYFSVHTDELGLRCDESRRMATKPNDSIDILFMGDSQGFGNGVNFEDTIAGTVAELAAQQGYVVRNACVGGQHPPNQLELAKWLRDQQGIKVYNYVYLFTPVGTASCDAFTEARVGADGNLYGESSGSLTSARKWIKTHSVVYSRVRDALRSKGIGVKPDEETPFVLRLYQAGESEQKREGKCVGFLKRFKEFAEQQGATVQLVYVPLTLETDFASIQRGAERRGLSVDAEAPIRVLSGAAKQANIPVYDLRPVLRTFHSKGQQLSLFPDFHYTAAVSRTCGESIWEYFTSKKTNVAEFLVHK